MASAAAVAAGAAVSASVVGLAQMRNDRDETFDYVCGHFTLSVSAKAGDDDDTPASEGTVRRNRLLEPYTKLPPRARMLKIISEILQNVMDWLSAHPQLHDEWAHGLLTGPAAYTPESGLFAALTVTRLPDGKGGWAVWIGLEHEDPEELITPLVCISVASSGTLCTTQFGCDAIDARTLLSMGTTHKGTPAAAVQGLVGGCQGVGFKQLAAVSAHGKLGLRVSGPIPTRFAAQMRPDRPLVGFEVAENGSDTDWVSLRGGAMDAMHQLPLPPVPDDFDEPEGLFGFQQTIKLRSLLVDARDDCVADEIYTAVSQAHLLLACDGVMSAARLVVPSLGSAWVGAGEGAFCFWANADAPAGALYLNGVRVDGRWRESDHNNIKLSGCDVSVAIFVHDPYQHSTANRDEGRALGTEQQRAYWTAVAEEAKTPQSPARLLLSSMLTYPDTPVAELVRQQRGVHDLKEVVATVAADHFRSLGSDGGTCVRLQDLWYCPEAMDMCRDQGDPPQHIAGYPVFDDSRDLKNFVETVPWSQWSFNNDDEDSGVTFPAIDPREAVSSQLIKSFPPTPAPTSNLQGLWPQVSATLLMLHSFFKKQLSRDNDPIPQLLFWHYADREMRESLFGYSSDQVMCCSEHPQLGDAIMVFTNEPVDTDVAALRLLESSIEAMIKNSTVPYSTRDGFQALLLHRVAASGEPLRLDHTLRQLLSPPTLFERSDKRRRKDHN